MTDTIRAPWTPEQVAALNQFQQQGGMHPFTCGGEHSFSSPTLVAHPDGWHCPAEPCTYQQDWAHAFMADPAVWPRRFSDRHGPTPEEARALIASATLPASDLVDTLIARLEAEEANVRRLADLAQVPEVRYADGGMACGLRTAVVLAVHHLRGPEARDAYIAATEGRERAATDNSRTTPDNSVASTDAADNFPDVQGRCPACGWTTLFLGDGGYVTCRRLECPQPDAASTLLERDVRGEEQAASEYAKTMSEPPSEQAAAHIRSRLSRLGDAVLHRGPGYNPTDRDEEMDRLCAELARMQEAGDHHIGGAEQERDQARAAIERVRALAERWDSALAPARSQYSGPVRAALDYSEAEPADGAAK